MLVFVLTDIFMGPLTFDTVCQLYPTNYSTISPAIQYITITDDPKPWQFYNTRLTRSVVWLSFTVIEPSFTALH